MPCGSKQSNAPAKRSGGVEDVGAQHANKASSDIYRFRYRVGMGRIQGMKVEIVHCPT